MTTIALLGAGGKMGLRITDRMRDSEYAMRYIEIDPERQGRLHERGVTVTPQDEALADADVVIMALPDALIGRLAPAIVAPLKPGAMVICLDPAAPMAGQLPPRNDITYFITHPCHPPVFNDEIDLEARHDYFGAIKARQHIVCALMQGPEEAYEQGVAIARLMFAPVMNAHRITTEQMAILEPALAETLAATCITIIREGLDEAIRRGVPPEAARDFLLGHINIELAIVFGQVSSPFSDGAIKAIEQAKSVLFQPDWKRIFEPEAIQQSVNDISGV
ncbi:MAG TPA: phosphogluconate dehydrogenase C-terminal domain-containing protein [Roseiflexaceae bacterium]|nr:phosphogluconate dehydrogenase C-terminal domain-containing protein [Roseiflexaceae bacterium]